MAGRYIFDASKGESPATLSRERIAMMQMGLPSQAPRNVGEGLNAVGRALIARQFMDEAKETQQAGQASAQEQWAALFGGMGGAGGGMSAPQAVPGAGVPPQAPMAAEMPPAAPAPVQPVTSMQPDLASAIDMASQTHGVPAATLQRIAQLESGGNTNAQNPNSSARGPFQFIDSTAQQYGLTDPTDPVASADAAARLIGDNAKVLRQTLGREPNEAELYLAHQQGATGASKLLTNPEAPAIQVVGRDAVLLNGGNENMTAGQFADMWMQRAGMGEPAPQDIVTEALMNRQMGQPMLPDQSSSMPTTAPLSPVANGIFGGAPGASIEQLATLASNPYLSAGQRTVLDALLKQQLQNSDPMRNLQMRKLEQELNAPTGQGFSLSPGQTRFGADGRPIASLPEAPPRDRESEARINALMSGRGMTRQQAENIVYNFEQVITDPTLQAPMIVDRTTGQGRRINTPDDQPQAQTAQPGPDRTLFSMADEIAGVRPAAIDAYNRVGPQLGLDPIGGVSGVRQEFQLATRDLVRALQTNPRFSEGERKAIAQDLDMGASIFDSPAALRERMTAIDTALRRRLENERRAATNPNLPSEQQRQALSAANHIENYLMNLGAPQPDAQGGTLSPADQDLLRKYGQ
jgi:hypothetical protein